MYLHGSIGKTTLGVNYVISFKLFFEVGDFDS